ncbi:nuclease-like protein [Flavobacterium sp. 9]|uniref:nuclease-related domain-containing protein n=1 Tax=Flavobacterium sp. 9 TaxID=2035198 RepID=UPI000C182F6C|nr:nuclease-related domain-containing protein [Flavobacterium sp. 9]PIF34739.1 nuclease-like protein [Flavobacterium sp. 9]
MCRTYNKIGSLTTLKLHLEEKKIYDFKSLKEVLDFQKSYAIFRQQLISHHENLIEEEKKRLNKDLTDLNVAIEIQRQQSVQILTNEIEQLKQELETLISTVSINLFQKLANPLKHWNYKRKIKNEEHNFDIVVKRSISKLVADYRIKSNRYQFITSHFNEAVAQSVQHSLLELERKKKTVDELDSFIYGALGEQKVVKILENLSDEYFLINDFTVSFFPAIFNRNENDYIKSVQIDHILVGPSGIFLIETKNWSEKSLKNLSLRSPIEQIKRSNFALFYLLNNEITNYHLGLDIHHWGEKKIPIKNLIVFTSAKPKEEFQYVKILTVNELVSYVKYFKPIFSYTETNRITEILLGMGEMK